jgi:hypothetical protein
MCADFECALVVFSAMTGTRQSHDDAAHKHKQEHEEAWHFLHNIAQNSGLLTVYVPSKYEGRDNKVCACLYSFVTLTGSTTCE